MQGLVTERSWSNIPTSVGRLYDIIIIIIMAFCSNVGHTQWVSHFHRLLVISLSVFQYTQRNMKLVLHPLALSTCLQPCLRAQVVIYPGISSAPGSPGSVQENGREEPREAASSQSKHVHDLALPFLPSYFSPQPHYLITWEREKVGNAPLLPELINGNV